MNTATETKIFDIDERITFSLQDETITSGVITGRDWSFSTLLFYSVRTDNGKRYHVNANDFQAGHSY